MRLLIHEFISMLKERAELDRLLPDLLRSMGYQIVKVAFRGEVEHGVDVAALRAENGRRRLYLFQVKSGDITPELWHDGANGVRASLDDIRDVEFEDRGNPRLKDAERVVVLVHNGVLRENCRAKWNGFHAKYPHELQRWDIDHLVELIQDHLLNEYLLPQELRRLLQKTIAFIDVPGYNFEHFKELLVKYFSSTESRLTASRLRQRFITLRLLMSLVHKYASEANDLTPSVTLSERAVLECWYWLLTRKDFRPTAKEQFAKTLHVWFGHTLEYISKLQPVFDVQEGLFLGGGHHEVVEYPIRCMELISTIGLAVMTARTFEITELTTALGNALASCVKHNFSGCTRPLLDNHMIPVYFGIVGLMMTGHRQLAQSWLSELFPSLWLRQNSKSRLPELNNRLDLVIEYEVTSERPVMYEDASSTLVYFLFELCLLLDRKDLFDNYRGNFGDVNLQVWYPDPNHEQELFKAEVHSGLIETSITLPDSFDRFSDQVRERHERFDQMDWLTAKHGSYITMLLASKHHKTPVIPWFWRAAIFEQPTE